MAVEHDPFTHIVNVEWEEAGGGIFVAGSVNVNNNVLAGKIEDLDKQLVMSKLDLQEFFGGNGIVNAASYANVGGTKPTFLLAGNDDGSIASGPHQNQVGVIVASEDGETWTTVLKLEEVRGDWQNFAAVLELVWHKESQAFYAGVYTEQHYVYDHTIEGHPIIRGETYNALYKSATGYSWSKIGELVNDGSNPDLESPLKPYYNPHTELPDGISSYWEQVDDQGTVVESIAVIPSNPPIPNYLHGSVHLDLDNPEPDEIIAKHFDGTRTETIFLKDGNIGCYAGGVYLIAAGGKLFASNGEGEIVPSTNDPDPWYSAGSIEPFRFNAMCGGPIEDQKSDEEGTGG